MTHTPARPGPTDSITDVPGLKVGQASDYTVRTGVTVLVFDRLSPAGCDISGGGPCTRETDALKPANLVGKLDALVFSGGSVYGLAAADTVTAVLGAQGRGVRLREDGVVPPAPIVASACLYDLANGGDKTWGETPPYSDLARNALAGLGLQVQQGAVGAGTGAMAGALKGGIGSASAVTFDGLTLGTLVAVNSFGSVVGQDGTSFLAEGAPCPEMDRWPHAKRDPASRANTTLVALATDAPLTTAQCERVSIMARAGLARAIRPVFAPFDGDVIFTIACGGNAQAAITDPFLIARLGALAADLVAKAVVKGIKAA